jgi:hypothetical protein
VVVEGAFGQLGGLARHVALAARGRAHEFGDHLGGPPAEELAVAGRHPGLW